MEVQQYLKSDLLTQKQTLTAIRSHCLKGIKPNFKKKLKKKLSEHCPLKCGSEESHLQDTQEYLL